MFDLFFFHPWVNPQILCYRNSSGGDESKQDVSLSEFQVELIQLASQLDGDHVLNTYPYIGKRQTSGKPTVLQRMLFKRFLEAGREALKAGANESAIVSLLP
ncbi:hypothetical protein M0R45_017630 [Rubus argutus]|uniref:Uncharacterized protein n=1 Tax=Rubus argutus TaxID=59490 RepID=A0AAW1XWP3_RUBAR